MSTEDRRKGIIEAVVGWAEDNDFTVMLLGTDEDRHGYADAILGTISEPRPAVVYLRSKVVEVFVEQGMSEEEADEWYEYNTVRALPYISEEDGRPIIVDDVVI